MGHTHRRRLHFRAEVHPPEATDQVQLYAEFDLFIVEGIMRFVPGFPTEAAEKTTAAQFLFLSASLLSSKTDNISFDWRGEVVCEGEIQLGSGTKLCSITFESANAL